MESSVPGEAELVSMLGTSAGTSTFVTALEVVWIGGTSYFCNCTGGSMNRRTSTSVTALEVVWIGVTIHCKRRIHVGAHQLEMAFCWPLNLLIRLFTSLADGVGAVDFRTRLWFPSPSMPAWLGGSCCIILVFCQPEESYRQPTVGVAHRPFGGVYSKTTGLKLDCEWQWTVSSKQLSVEAFKFTDLAL